MLLFHDLQSIFLETESREWFGDYGASGDVSRFGIVWFPDWLQSRVGRGTWQGLTQLPHLNSCSQEALLDRSICVTLETSKICQSLLVFYSRQISYWAVAMTLWCTALWRLTFSRSWLFEKKSPCPRLLHPVTSLTTCCDDMKIDIFQQNLGSHVGLLTHLMIEISTKLYVVRMHNAQCTLQILPWLKCSWWQSIHCDVS